MPLYCILPGGNAVEFPKLERELRSRKVRSFKLNLRAGGRAYKINVKYQHLLPHDRRGPYLGDDWSGHSLFRSTSWSYQKSVRELAVKGSDWVSVYPPPYKSTIHERRALLEQRRAVRTQHITDRMKP